MAAGLVVSALGAAAGGAAANAMGGSDGGNGNASAPVNIPDTISQMNTILNNALGNAVNTSTGLTNQAIGQQNQSLGAATSALTAGNNAANNAVAQNVNTGTKENQALNAPYSSAGYQALDNYMGTLGLATPVGGSQALSQNLYNAAQINPAIQSLQQAAQANNNTNPYQAVAPMGAAPTLANYSGGISASQIANYLAQNETFANGNRQGKASINVGGSIFNEPNPGSLGWGDSYTPLSQAIANQLAQPQYQTALNQYNSQASLNQAQQIAYNNVGNVLQSTGATPQGLAQAAAYNSGNISGVK